MWMGRFSIRGVPVAPVGEAQVGASVRSGVLNIHDHMRIQHRVLSQTSGLFESDNYVSVVL